MTTVRSVRIVVWQSVALLACALLASTLLPAPAHAATCGDGVLDLGETCDDGNVLSGDGCAATCQYEAGYRCNGAPSLCCFDGGSFAYKLAGSAVRDANTGEVTLTTDDTLQTGYAWYKQTLDFTVPFAIAFRLNLGQNDEGADGGALIFQRDPAGTDATGDFGLDLGVTGIAPSVAVEFDTYGNAAAYNDVTVGDEDHTSVFHDSPIAANQLTPPACLNDDTTCENYEDGAYHQVRVEWTGLDDHHLKVYVDGNQRIDLDHDLVADYFADDPAEIYFGVTATTGGAGNLQKFCPMAPIGFGLPRDADGDGIDDSVDLDDDDDGVSDLTEILPFSLQADPSGDHDHDGIPNYRDRNYWESINNTALCPDVAAPIGECDGLPPEVDRDGDGIPNHLDLDSDGDETLDATDDETTDPCVPSVDVAACPTGDPDADTLPNSQECPNPAACPDSDGDGAFDYRDRDSDNDTLQDYEDEDVADPCVPSTAAAACTTGDADSDGVSNGVECTDARDCEDSDDDGTPDFQDEDSDGDGTLDDVDSAAARVDACVPSTDPVACKMGDFDDDGIMNAAECPLGPSMCVDSDGDGVADYADSDSDDDGVADHDDATRTNPCMPSDDVLACASGDVDSDGIPNGVECADPQACADTDGDGDPDYDDLDADGDGIDDADECTDDVCEDADDDGLADYIESNMLDTDADGDVDAADDDADGDGDDDGDECEALPCPDADEDGIPDQLDADDFGVDSGDGDDDGILDSIECPSGWLCVDTDGDGTPNFADQDSDADGIDDDADEGPTDPCVPSSAVPQCASGDADGDSVLNGDECSDPGDCENTDGDEQADYLDMDSDDDGITDGVDGLNGAERRNACAPSENAVSCISGDFDGDGEVNLDDEEPLDACVPNADAVACETGDSDGDEIVNGDDDQPEDPCLPNADAVACDGGDADGDGIENGDDSAPEDACRPNKNGLACDEGDFDHDGVDNKDDDEPEDACEPSRKAVACDSGDTDGDGVENGDDSAPKDACKPNKNAVACDGSDTDGDGVDNGDDAAPRDPCMPDANAESCPTGDSDHDGAPNGLDTTPRDACIPFPDSLHCITGDTDGDGVRNSDDASPEDACKPSSDAAQCEKGDADGDGLTNGDECPDAKACPDTDDDGTPDYQDDDDDGDGIATRDECADPDACSDLDDDGEPDYLDADDDGDGTATNDECSDPTQCADSDGDGVPDYQDDRDNDAGRPDSDHDGRPDSDECEHKAKCPDTDHDGKDDAHDSDDDGDDIRTAVELAHEKKFGRDVDHDGVPNHLDTDSDDDGIPDAYERGDKDYDGRPDYLQANEIDLRGGGGVGCSVSGRGTAAGLGTTWLMLLGTIGLIRARGRRERCERRG